MSREIKFRAWDVGRERMWYKDSISYDANHIQFVFFNGGIGWGVYDNKLGNRLVTGDPNAIFNRPGLLMQYTGLKDKNGKEIYEGDILLCITKNFGLPACGFVEFINSQFAINVGKQLIDDENDYYAHFWSHEAFEVIGNIYENPELLNSEQGVQVSDTTEPEKSGEAGSKTPNPKTTEQ